MLVLCSEIMTYLLIRLEIESVPITLLLSDAQLLFKHVNMQFPDKQHVWVATHAPSTASIWLCYLYHNKQYVKS